jgi:hypothetical protein
MPVDPWEETFTACEGPMLFWIVLMQPLEHIVAKMRSNIAVDSTVHDPTRTFFIIRSFSVLSSLL